ncbi:hypothetical protein ZWY2020_051372 [Hordeum vulgare]|nr:hypothetical protein ZWY2020_051372 [Hordeum vulgare]
MLVSPTWSVPLEGEGEGAAALSTDFHARTCPQLKTIVRSMVKAAIKREVALAAGLLRIFFHDCFPQGCDASIYLRGRGTEQAMDPNKGLQPRALKLVDDIRAKVHAACGPTVSCADISALATREAVIVSGGPTYSVPQGQLDSFGPAPESKVLSSLPSPSLSSVFELGRFFSAKGLRTWADLVALSGAHTIGRAGCGFFVDRTRRGGDAFARRLKTNCTRNPQRLQNLDVVTPNLFDNGYYKALVARKGVFTSDMALIRNNRTEPIVKRFARDKNAFFIQFAKSMTKLANMHRPKGNTGQIRRRCFRPNGRPYVMDMDAAVDVQDDYSASASASA